MDLDKYVGKRWRWSLYDCGTIIVSYLNDMYGLNIKDKSRRLYYKDKDFALNTLLENDMIIVNDDIIKPGDVLIFYYKDWPCHCAVCVEGETYLSIEPKDISRTYTKDELFNKYKLAYHLRHKKLM